MKTRWGYSEQKTDDVIEEAIEDYGNLIRTLFTGSSAEDRAASLKWARNWVKKWELRNPIFSFLHVLAFIGEISLFT